MEVVKGVTLPVCEVCGQNHEGLEPHRLPGAIVYHDVIYIDFVTCPTTGERVYIVLEKQ